MAALAVPTALVLTARAEPEAKVEPATQASKKTNVKVVTSLDKLAEGLVGYYPFEGDARDASGKARSTAKLTTSRGDSAKLPILIVPKAAISTWDIMGASMLII